MRNNIEKPPAGVCNDDDDSNYFSHLPDEIVLLIFNKIIDLKTLCNCKLVSTHFNLIVDQVDTVSFVAEGPSYDANDPSSDDIKLLRFLPDLYDPLLGPLRYRVAASSFNLESFESAMQSMSKFTRLKSLCVEFPSTRKHADGHGSVLYTWKVKVGRAIKSLVYLSPNSVCDMNGLVSDYDNVNGQEEEVEDDDKDLRSRKYRLAFGCLKDVATRFSMLLGFTMKFPLLEKVLIKQSGKRGSVSISGENIVEMRKWLLSPSDSFEQKLNDSMYIPGRTCRLYVPLLKLPVSGYLMKGVTLIMFKRNIEDEDDDSTYMNPINLNDFEDKEEAAYGEAVMEMSKILHRGQVKWE